MSNNLYASLEDAVVDVASGFLGRRLPLGVALAVAGQVVDGETRVLNACGKQSSFSWPATTAKLISERLGGVPVLLLNDLEASMSGVLWLYNRRLLSLQNMRGAFSFAGNCAVGLVIPGTGCGLAYCFGVDGSRQVGHSELAHWPWSRGRSDLPQGFESYASSRLGGEVLSVEHVVSGPGLSLLFSFLCFRDSGEMIFLTCEEVVEAAKQFVAGGGNDSRLQLAYRSVVYFAKEIGRLSAMYAMAINCRSGILLAGDVVRAIFDVVGVSDFLAAFDQCDWGSNMQCRIPIGLVGNRVLALTGAMSEWESAAVRSSQCPVSLSMAVVRP
jgi:glucokinase